MARPDLARIEVKRAVRRVKVFESVPLASMLAIEQAASAFPQWLATRQRPVRSHPKP